MNKSISEVSSAGVSASLTTEPDFGNWLSGGARRELGNEMNGKSDAWYRNGGYTQTEFPVADAMWGGNFDDLTVFNLDPGIYRTSAQHRLKVPSAWSQQKTPSKTIEVPKPNTTNSIEFERIPEAEPITDFSYEVPNYKDFF